MTIEYRTLLPSEVEQVPHYENTDRNWVGTLTFYSDEIFDSVLCTMPKNMFLTVEHFRKLREASVLFAYTSLGAVGYGFEDFSHAMRQMVGNQNFYDATNLMVAENFAGTDMYSSSADNHQEGSFSIYQQLTVYSQTIEANMPPAWDNVDKLLALFTAIMVCRYEFIELDIPPMIEAIEKYGYDRIMGFYGSGVAPDLFDSMIVNDIDFALGSSLS